MKKHIYTIVTLLCISQALSATDLTKSTIVYNQKDHPLVQQMATVLSEDIERVTGIKPEISTKKGNGQNIILSTLDKTSRHKELKGSWESFAIDTNQDNLYITGSDARGLAYGVFHVSEQIGVNPWYWFADIPVDKGNKKAYDYQENYVSASPTIKYRGIFIVDPGQIIQKITIQ